MAGSVMNASFFEHNHQGWHWYEDPPKAQKPKKKKTQKQKSTQKPPVSYTQRFEGVQKALKESLHRALLQPTPVHVAHYQRLQQQWMQQSQSFASVWSQNLLRDVRLDDSARMPMAQWARPLYYQQKHHEEDKRLSSLSKRIGLFFIFHPQCTYAQSMAVLMEQLSQRYGFTIMGLRLSQGVLRGFEEAKPMPAAFPVNIDHSPALVAMDPVTKKVHVVSLRLESFEDIRQKLLVLETITKGNLS